MHYLNHPKEARKPKKRWQTAESVGWAANRKPAAIHINSTTTNLRFIGVAPWLLWLSRDSYNCSGMFLVAFFLKHHFVRVQWLGKKNRNRWITCVSATWDVFFPTSGDPFRAGFCANCIKLWGFEQKVQTLEENVFKQGHTICKKTGYAPENLIVQATICVAEGLGLHGKYKQLC